MCKTVRGMGRWWWGRGDSEENIVYVKGNWRIRVKSQTAGERKREIEQLNKGRAAVQKMRRTVEKREGKGERGSLRK